MEVRQKKKRNSALLILSTDRLGIKNAKSNKAIKAEICRNLLARFLNVLSDIVKNYEEVHLKSKIIQDHRQIT
jgi:hypothetical protein